MDRLDSKCNFKAEIGAARPNASDDPLDELGSQPKISDVIVHAKALFKDSMAEKYPYIQSLCALPDTTTSKFIESTGYDKLMKSIGEANRAIYPVGSQFKDRARQQDTTQAFLKEKPRLIYFFVVDQFQDMVEAQIEESFEQSGLIERCTELERLNCYLYELLINLDDPQAINKGSSSSINFKTFRSNNTIDQNQLHDTFDRRSSIVKMKDNTHDKAGFDQIVNTDQKVLGRKLAHDSFMEGQKNQPSQQILSKNDDQSFRDPNDQLNLLVGEQQMAQEKNYFDEQYELLKIEIMKRLKKDLNLQEEKWIASKQQSDKKAKEHYDYYANRHKFNKPWDTDFSCHQQNIIKDEDFFRTLRKEILEVLHKQNVSYQQQYDQKVQDIQKNNFALRKTFLRELHHLKQTHFLKNSKLIDPETALQYSSVKLFQFDEGLDEDICVLLNTKIKQLTVEFTSQINELQTQLQRSNQTIKKYQALSPKVFKLAELSLEEVFDAFSKIHTDSFEIFNTLLRSYPQNYFVGVIEDTFGAFFDDKGEIKLHQQLERIQVDMRREVAAIAQNIQLERAKYNSITQSQSNYILELNRAHVDCENQLAKALEPKIKKVVAAEKARLQQEHKLSCRILVEKSERNKKKYQMLKQKNLENESRMAFFKWKILMVTLKQKKAQDFRGIMKTLISNDREKMQNSLLSRDEKINALRDMLQSTEQQLFSLQKSYDQVFAVNLELQIKCDAQQNSYQELFHRTHSTLIPRVTELIAEKEALKKELDQSMELVHTIQEQLILIEEKYNVRGKKVHIDPKERVLLRIFNEFKVQKVATCVLINKQIHQALETDPGFFKPLIPSDKQKQKYAKISAQSLPEAPPMDPIFLPEKYNVEQIHLNVREAECQTDLQNLDLDLKAVDRNDDLKKQVMEITKHARVREVQTDVDYELWDEMVQAHHVYREMLYREEYEDIEFPVVNINILPQKIRGSFMDNQKDNQQEIYLQYPTGPSGPQQRGANQRSRQRANASKQSRAASNLSHSPNQSIVLDENGRQIARPNQKNKSEKKRRENKRAVGKANGDKKSDFDSKSYRAKGSDDELDFEEDLGNQKGEARAQSSLAKKRLAMLKNTEEEDKALKQQLKKLKEQRELIQQIEDELSLIEPIERFDRVRFIFETNIDLVDYIKDKQPALYKEAVAQIKGNLVSEHENNQKMLDYNPIKKVWRQALMENSALQLKRLYPRNQPEVYNRLHKALDDKEFKTFKTWRDTNNIRWEKKFSSTTGTSSDFAHLLSQIQRKKSSKGDQLTLAQAQRELMYYINLRHKERAQSAGRQRNHQFESIHIFDQNSSLQGPNLRQSQSIGKGGLIETARCMNCEELYQIEQAAQLQQQTFMEQFGIPITNDTFKPNIVYMKGKDDSKLKEKQAATQKSKEVQLKKKQSEIEQHQYQNQVSQADQNSNRVFAVPEMTHPPSLSNTVNQIKQDHKRVQAVAKTHRLDLNQNGKSRIRNGLNQDLSVKTQEAMMGPIKTDNAILRQMNKKVSESELGKKNKQPDLIVQQVGDDDSRVATQKVQSKGMMPQRTSPSQMSQSASQQQLSARQNLIENQKEETAGEASARMEFTAIYNNSNHKYKYASSEMVDQDYKIASGRYFRRSQHTQSNPRSKARNKQFKKASALSQSGERQKNNLQMALSSQEKFDSMVGAGIGTVTNARRSNYVRPQSNRYSQKKEPKHNAPIFFGVTGTKAVGATLGQSSRVTATQTIQQNTEIRPLATNQRQFNLKNVNTIKTQYYNNQTLHIHSATQAPQSMNLKMNNLSESFQGDKSLTSNKILNPDDNLFGPFSQHTTFLANTNQLTSHRPTNQQTIERDETDPDDNKYQKHSIQIEIPEDTALNQPLTQMAGRHAATIKIFDSSPHQFTNIQVDSIQNKINQKKNIQSSSEIVLKQGYSTEQNSIEEDEQAEVAKNHNNRQILSQVGSNESVPDEYATSTALNDKINISENQTTTDQGGIKSTLKVKSRRGDNIVNRKSSAANTRSNKYQESIFKQSRYQNSGNQTGQGISMSTAKYKLQSDNQDGNINAQVKIHMKRVRPLTGKQNGGRKLVRYRQSNRHIHSKKSQTSELMKDFLKQDKKLSNLNFNANNQSSASLLVDSTNVQRNTQPVTMRELILPQNQLRSNTFDTTHTPNPHLSVEIQRANDPISAFNKNNKKVSAFMHKVVSDPSSPLNIGNKNPKMISFGIPLQKDLRAEASVFQLGQQAQGGADQSNFDKLDQGQSKLMTNFMNTNIQHTNSLLIVENKNNPDQIRTDKSIQQPLKPEADLTGHALVSDPSIGPKLQTAQSAATTVMIGSDLQVPQHAQLQEGSRAQIYEDHRSVRLMHNYQPNPQVFPGFSPVQSPQQKAVPGQLNA